MGQAMLARKQTHADSVWQRIKANTLGLELSSVMEDLL